MSLRKQLFILNVVWGVFSIVIGVVGLYFVFRYGVAVLSSGDDTRKLLLGDYVAGIVGDTEITVVITLSLYIGFRVVYLIINAATLENWAQREYKSVYSRPFN
jgi:hypothetical protein